MEGPRKGNAALEAHEQRRIAERCQAAAHVGDEKDKEHHEVYFVLAPGISPDKRTDEQHRRAGRANPAGQEGADEQQETVDLRRTGQGPTDSDAAGDDEQAEEEDDEGNVIEENRLQEPEPRFTDAISSGKGNEE